MRAEGYGVELLSGDREGPVSEVAATLGIDDFRAGARPGDKVARLAELEAAGRKVLMIGGGLNDAPSLAGAFVSVSP